jgi:DNA-binding MarR family transcriptional regulator
MALNTYNRASEHADLKSLTPAETLVFKEIAFRTNGTKADLMRLGVRYLAKATGLSVRKVTSAITSLIGKGLLTATQASKRKARVFVVMVDCPADCKQVKNHYSPAEKKALIAIEKASQESAECGTFEPLSVEQNSPLSVELLTAECGTEFITNKELNKEIIKNLNTRDLEPVTDLVADPLASVLVSIAQWKKICSDTLNQLPQSERSTAHLDLAANPEKYHASALSFLATKENISSPIGYLAKVFRDNPQALMVAATTEQKTSELLHRYILDQFSKYSQWKDTYTQEPLHNYQALAADMMRQPELTDWLETFSKWQSLSSRKFDEVAYRLLRANPSAYEPLETATPANAY